MLRRTRKAVLGAFSLRSFFAFSIMAVFWGMPLLAIDRCSRDPHDILQQLSHKHQAKVMNFYYGQLFLKKLSAQSHNTRQYNGQLKQAYDLRVAVNDVQGENGRIDRQKYTKDFDNYVITFDSYSFEYQLYLGTDKESITPHALVGYNLPLVYAGGFELTDDGRIKIISIRSSTYMEGRDREIKRFVNELLGVNEKSSDHIVNHQKSIIEDVIKEFDRQHIYKVLMSLKLSLANPDEINIPFLHSRYKLDTLITKLSEEQRKEIMNYYYTQLHLDRLSALSHSIRQYTPRLKEAYDLRVAVDKIQHSDGRIDKQKYTKKSDNFIIAYDTKTDTFQMYLGVGEEDRTPHALLAYNLPIVYGGSFHLTDDGIFESISTRSGTYMERRDRVVKQFIENLPGIKGRNADYFVAQKIHMIKSIFDELDRFHIIQVLGTLGVILEDPAETYISNAEIKIYKE